MSSPVPSSPFCTDPLLIGPISEVGRKVLVLAVDDEKEKLKEAVKRMKRVIASEKEVAEEIEEEKARTEASGKE